MKRFQTATLLTALILGSTATASLAEKYETVTRGPNGAAVRVKSDRIPVAAQQQPKTAPHDFPQVVTRGPGGAGHPEGTLMIKSDGNFVATPQIINRGPNGGGQLK